MSGAQSPPPSLPGFTYTQWIGGGGFADVFLFTQHSTKRPVAVKVLRAEHLSVGGLEQFQTEADTMARVSAHPYIVTILDAGVAPDGRPFIVMEHYPQPHFGLRARGGGLRVPEVLKVAVQVCAAVETAHRADVLHRDIKPANILTSAYGDPGLTDFGIAGVQVDEHLSAASGVTPGFAAPEVILDEAATGSRSSDVYALGATVYALLAGRSPIYIPGGDNSAAALHSRAARNAVLPLHRDDVPRSFQHLLSAALATDPDHRPTGAAALGQALQDIEQELHLPPTPLVLVGTDVAAPRRAESPLDEEGTRRKARVVHADGAPVVGRAPSPTFAPPPAPTPATPPEPAPNLISGPPAAFGDDPATRARGAAGPAATDRTIGRSAAPTVSRPGATTSHPEPGPAAAPPGTPRPRWLVPAGAAAAVVVVLAVGAITLSSGDDRGTVATSTTLARGTPRQDPTSVGTTVGPPSAVTAERTADGTLTVTWEPPTTPDDVAPGDFTYRVLRADDGHDAFEFGEDEVTGTKFVAEEVSVADSGGVVCVTVAALVGSNISEPPVKACTATP